MEKRIQAWMGLVLLLLSEAYLIIYTMSKFHPIVRYIVVHVMVIGSICALLPATYQLMLNISPILFGYTGAVQAKRQEEIGQKEAGQTTIEPKITPSNLLPEPNAQLNINIGTILYENTGNVQTKNQEGCEGKKVDQTTIEPETAPSNLVPEPKAQQAIQAPENNQTTQEVDIPKHPWELIPDVGNDRLIVRLWHEGESLKDIATALDRKPHTIRNRISILRGIYGDGIVPKDGSRKKKE